jgi:hypothetical protein
MHQVLVLEDFPSPSLARVLSPNGRAHGLSRYAAGRHVRDRVKIETTRQGLRAMRPPVVLRAAFTYPLARERDDDNLATGVLKAARDGLVRAGILAGDDAERLRQEPVAAIVERGQRRLVIELEEV